MKPKHDTSWTKSYNLVAEERNENNYSEQSDVSSAKESMFRCLGAFGQSSPRKTFYYRELSWRPSESLIRRQVHLSFKVTPYSYLARGDWVLTYTGKFIMLARETGPVLGWSKAPVSQLVNADDTSVIEIKTQLYIES